MSDRGSHYRCTIEFSANQRVARGKGKRDNREGTIEKDADYKEFLEQLEKGPQTLPSAEVQLQKKEAASATDGASSQGPTQTALMQYLKEKRAKKLAKVSKRAANHAAKVKKGKSGATEGERNRKGRKRGEGAAAKDGEDGGGVSSSKRRERKREKKEKGETGRGKPRGGAKVANAQPEDSQGNKLRGKSGPGGTARGGFEHQTSSGDQRATSQPPKTIAIPKVLQRPPGLTSSSTAPTGTSTITATTPAMASSSKTSSGSKPKPTPIPITTTSAGTAAGRNASLGTRGAPPGLSGPSGSSSNQSSSGGKRGGSGGGGGNRASRGGGGRGRGGRGGGGGARGGITNSSTGGESSSKGGTTSSSGSKVVVPIVLHKRTKPLSSSDGTAGGTGGG